MRSNTEAWIVFILGFMAGAVLLGLILINENKNLLKLAQTRAIEAKCAEFDNTTGKFQWLIGDK